MVKEYYQTFKISARIIEGLLDSTENLDNSTLEERYSFFIHLTIFFEGLSKQILINDLKNSVSYQQQPISKEIHPPSFVGQLGTRAIRLLIKDVETCTLGSIHKYFELLFNKKVNEISQNKINTKLEIINSLRGLIFHGNTIEVRHLFTKDSHRTQLNGKFKSLYNKIYNEFKDDFDIKTAPYNFLSRELLIDLFFSLIDFLEEIIKTSTEKNQEFDLINEKQIIQKLKLRVETK